jgi:hypothetical protein
MLSIRDNPRRATPGNFLTPAGVPVERLRVLGPGHPSIPAGAETTQPERRCRLEGPGVSRELCKPRMNQDGSA